MTFRGKTVRQLGIALSMTLLSAACAEARPLVAGNVDARAPGPLVSAAGGYELEVLVDGVPAPTFFRGGDSYVLGALGARYTLRIVNHTGRRIEAVASVDGRDVVDDKPADFRGKRGYLVPAWGSVDVDGWRLSRAEVAAFRFSWVADSYAARTGSAHEVGVIGVAVFPERYVPSPRPLALPYTDPRASEPYRYRDDRGSNDDELYEDGPRGAAPRAESARRKSADSAPPSAAEAAPSPSAGGSAAPRAWADARPSRRPGLGTEFGEAVGSTVHEVSFLRANPSSPAVVLGARYNDREGLVALGIDVDRDPYACGGGSACDRDLELRQTASPFPVTERRFSAPPPCWNGRSCR